MRHLLLSLAFLLLPSLSHATCLPPLWEENAILYLSFEDGKGRPEISRGDIKVLQGMEVGEGGIRGLCAIPTSSHRILLQGKSLSPEGALTISFWWCLREALPQNGSFGLVHLWGDKGYISHFARGDGWCGLNDTGAVLQVYYFPHIQNVNYIYWYPLRQRLDLSPGVWHHQALVIQGGSLLSVYIDGEMTAQVRLRGRRFSPADNIQNLSIGGGAYGGEAGHPLAIDELVILKIPLSQEEIREYYRALLQMKAIGYPLLPSD